MHKHTNAKMGADLVRMPESTSTQATNVMVVYQNAETRKWATNVCPQSNGTLYRSTWWNIEDLAEPGVLAGAVSTAIRADIIIVAVVKDRRLPLPFYVWVNAWLPHRHLRAGKLVRLIGIQPGVQRASRDSAKGYFRELAKQGNLALEEEERVLGYNGSAKGAADSRTGIMNAVCGNRHWATAI